MYAHTIREERFGDPVDAFCLEYVDTPEIGEDECLVAVMATGINYNGIWAGYGRPINVIDGHRRRGDHRGYHVAGSEASGIVYEVGSAVSTVKVGDHVVLHGGWWDCRCPRIRAGEDPMLTPSHLVWGYETNDGSFGQFTRVKAHQVLSKPAHLTWEEAAVYTVNGGAAYRGLFGFEEHRVRRGDVVLVWGGAGGLGTLAIQLVVAAGGRPIAVVSDDAKSECCRALGAVGVINRKKFDHWGVIPDWRDAEAYHQWLSGARAFGKEIWRVLGERRNPRIVFEHPGESTLPTSCFVCAEGGMVVICAGTTGYTASLDLRRHWMRQKRLQGTHGANTAQYRAFNDMIASGVVDPCLSRTFTFDQLPEAHQLMHLGQHPYGNMAALVGAPEMGLGREERG